MTCQIHHVPFAQPLLARLAADLTAEVGGGRTAPDFDGVMVLLPSQRACRTLEQLLLEAAGRPALILPRVQTLERWTADLALACGLAAERVPHDRSRPLALAPRLADLALPLQPGSAPGLAAEFVRFFDEVRLCGRQAPVLELPGAGRSDGSRSPWPSGPWDEALAGELRLIARVWRAYRAVVPRDRIDRIVDLAALAVRDPQRLWSRAPRPTRLWVAGFGHLDVLPARILAAGLGAEGEHRLYVPQAEGALDRALLATWPPDRPQQRQAGTDPLAPTRRLLRALAEAGLTAAASRAAVGDDQPEAPVPPLRVRLEQAGRAAELAGPQGPLQVICCPDAEAESRQVADLVVRTVQQQKERPLPSGGGGAEACATATVAVAVGDPNLARRIAAHLRDAGLDLDQTHGRPLSTLPAGLLVRFILRSALTDLRAEPLLEVLGHPFVCLGPDRRAHGLWTLRLERMFRRQEGPSGGLAGLSRRAADRDRIVSELFSRRGPQMAAFVQAVGEAFAPLAALRDGRPHPWPELLQALRTAWFALTGGGPAPGADDARDEDEQESAREAEDVGAPAGADPRRPDVAALYALWDDLLRDAAHFAPATLGEAAADLNRLLGEEQVRALRPRTLPVTVMGLVEARLERFDHLILAGLRDTVVPSRPPARPLLPPRAAAGLGLPGWRDHLGLEAELFLRLLHNGGRVTLTWSREDEGREHLPSPFVSRLQMALGLPPERIPQAPADLPLWRRREAPWDALHRKQRAFAAEPRPCPALAPGRPRTDLSWSALRTWRDCPYRFLLERSYGLRKDDDLRREFGRMDYGNLVHRVLREFLDPASGAAAALTAGRRAQAQRILQEVARRVFAEDAQDLPVRRLWLDGFARLAPRLVAAEVERAQVWRPALLEHEFAVPLADLLAWARTQATSLQEPAPRADLPPWAAQVRLCGFIDRVDAAHGDPGRLAVLDYKTGRAPTPGEVRRLRDLQVILYAAALEAGAVADLPQPGRVAAAAYYPLTAEEVGPAGEPHLDLQGPRGRGVLLQGTLALIDLALQAADPMAEHPLIPDHVQGRSQGPLPCRTCDLRGACRIEDLPREHLPAAVRLQLDRLINRKEGEF